MKSSPLLVGLLALPAVSGCWLLTGLDDKRFTLGEGGAGAAGGSDVGAGGGAGGGLAACGTGAPPVLPLISRDLPAFGTAGYPPPNANDQDYGSYWRSAIPAWLAYDMSGVDAELRETVLVIWYNGGGDYDHALLGFPAYNNLGSYTIEVSTAPGGNVPTDDSDWTPVATVENNTLRSRQHIIDFTGQNWIRLHVSESDGSDQNEDAAVQLDVFSLAGPVCDDWILFGDELMGFSVDVTPIEEDPNVAELVEAALPGRFPLIEYASMSGWTANDLRTQFGTPESWLAQFPGRYVAIGLGAKEAEMGTSPESFLAHLGDLATRILGAGKIPVVATIPPKIDASQTEAIMALNAQIEIFFDEFPEAVRGADLWTAFEGTDGFEKEDLDDERVYRDAWLQALLAVYAE